MERARESGIYVIYNRVSHHYYIGSTNDRDVRWRHHCSRLRRRVHENPHLQAAWVKYTPEPFVFLWIEDVSEDQLLVVEQRYLDLMPGEYNIARNARAPTKGIRWTEERKKAASVAATGRKHTEETKKWIGDIQRGKPKKATRTGQTQSDAEREKKSASLKEYYRTHAGHNKGKKMPPHEVEKSRARMMGNQYTKGRKCSAEEITKRTATLRENIRKKREAAMSTVA